MARESESHHLRRENVSESKTLTTERKKNGITTNQE